MAARIHKRAAFLQFMKKIEFKPPPAFVAPENKKDGDKFSALAEFQIKGEKLCLVGIDGNDMPGYEDKDDDDMTPAQKAYHENYTPPGRD